MFNRLIDLMFTIPRAQKKLIVLGVDFALVSLSYYLAISLSHNKFIYTFAESDIPHYLLSTIISLLIFGFLGFYSAITRFINFKILLKVAMGALLAGTVTSIMSLFYFKGSYLLSSSIIFVAMLCLFLGGVRVVVKAYFSARFNTLKQKVIIYGAGAAGQQLALSLINGNEYYPVAFVDDDKSLQNSFVQGLKVYAIKELQDLVEYFRPKKILLALPSLSKSQRKKIISKVEPFGVPIQTIPGVSDIVDGKMKIDEFQDVEIDDLLGRDSVPPSQDLLKKNVFNKTVMVTGAGGSIGSELCRQILKLKPQQLLLLEVTEYALYSIEKELKELALKESLEIKLLPFLGTVQNENRLKNILSTYQVDTLYHAAAYKHVPMVEYNVVEGVRNNIFGTLSTAKAAISSGVETFVLVSTDKAVRPTNVMGATKRMAELVLQALAKTDSDTCFCMVRFGNVLGSSGSVVPLFKKQIKQGGPVTVTHPDIIRYFMTIPEAAQLVIQSGAMGKGGDVFVLDMGEPVRIADLAKRIISLMGLELMDESNPSGDIQLEYTGLRPGEKLYEELLIGDDVTGTQHPRIMTANEVSLSWLDMRSILDSLDKACTGFDQATIRNILLNAPTGFNPSDGICDLVWTEKHKANIVNLPTHKKGA